MAVPLKSVLQRNKSARRTPAGTSESSENGLRRAAGGAEGNRTPDLCSAIAALSHLSYSPAPWVSAPLAALLLPCNAPFHLVRQGLPPVPLEPSSSERRARPLVNLAHAAGIPLPVRHALFWR